MTESLAPRNIAMRTADLAYIFTGQTDNELQAGQHWRAAMIKLADAKLKALGKQSEDLKFDCKGRDGESARKVRNLEAVYRHI